MLAGRKYRHGRWPFAVGLAISMAVLASGCLWGFVTDADTGDPVPGVTVGYTDSEGHTDSATTNADGLYVFDQASGPVPSTGPISFELSAPGFDPLTAAELIGYDDNGAATLANPSSFWEVQNFSISREKVQTIEVDLLSVDVDQALLAPPTPVSTLYSVGFRLFDPADPSTPLCDESVGPFPVLSPDPAPQSLDLHCGLSGDDFEASVTVVLVRNWMSLVPPHIMMVDTDTSTAHFDWIAPSLDTAWQNATLDSTDATAPDDPDLEFEAQIRFRSVFGPISVSDRNRKDNFRSVDGDGVLARLASVPITTWNYKAEDPSIRHMGPMAQDFRAAFGLGEDDRHIFTLDADGVALAAIQALNQAAQEKDGQISALERLNAELQARVAALEQAVNSLVTP